MAERNQKDWRELCTAVVNETDSNKLRSLVQKLVEALDQNRRPRIDPCGENLEPPDGHLAGVLRRTRGSADRSS
jgi:hypothetical protein